MYNPIKNKRGIELAFGIIIGIVILLLSVVIIVVVIKDSASKADEKTQVELCRVSNEIKLGIDRRTGTATDILLGPAPRICNTIPKIKKKSRVPVKMYPQDKGGAEAEIREMIKNCWYMWLEGSEPNMFDKTFGSDCFVCYKFLIKDKVDEDVEFMSLAESMTEPFFVEDASDKCSPVGGFLIPCVHACVDEKPSLEACLDKCNAKFGAVTSCEDIHIRPDDSDEWVDTPSEKATAKSEATTQDVKCCISKNPANECENKGGMCSEEGIYGDYTRIYYKWYCPKKKQRCYVKEEHMFSYIKYITEYGRYGGNVYFIPPEGAEYPTSVLPDPPEATSPEVTPVIVGLNPEDITYPTGETYAISFISPSEQFCADDPLLSSSCMLSIGGGVAIGATAVGVGILTVGAVPAVIIGVTVKMVADRVPVVGRALHKVTDWVLSSVREPVPSFMIVSTLDRARDFGCKVGMAS